MASSAFLALSITVCATCSIAAEVSSMVAACLVVRSLRSLAPDRISPVAVFRPREVSLIWFMTSTKRSTVWLSASRTGSKSACTARCDARIEIAIGELEQARRQGIDRFLARGRVGGILDDFDCLAVQIQDRVVGGLDPDFPAALADAQIFGSLVFAAPERRPEGLVVCGAGIGRFDEHRMMPALDLGKRIAERRKKVLVGHDDVAGRGELDHRLRLADGRNLAFEIGVAQLLRRDVDGELDHLEGFAVRIEDRIIGRLDPDFAPALADALELAAWNSPRRSLSQNAAYSALAANAGSTNMRWCLPSISASV